MKVFQVITFLLFLLVVPLTSRGMVLESSDRILLKPVRVDAANVVTVDLTDYIIDFYVSKSSSFNLNNATRVGTTYGYSLRVGDKVNHSFSFVFPTYISNTSTSTWVWAKVTNRGIIEPTDKENNNTASGTITIYGSSY